jgi:hypothetical protein
MTSENLFAWPSLSLSAFTDDVEGLEARGGKLLEVLLTCVFLFGSSVMTFLLTVSLFIGISLLSGVAVGGIFLFEETEVF